MKNNEHLVDALALANRRREDQRQTTAWRDRYFFGVAQATPAWHRVTMENVASVVEEMSR